MTIKECKDWANETLSDGVTSKAKLMDALPKLIDAQDYLKSLARFIREANERVKAVSDACAAYAKAHTNLLDGVETSPIGVKSVEVVIGDDIYHGAFGFDGYKRASGEKLTQEFLNELPEKWVKAELKLSTTGVNKTNPTAEELEKHDLFQVPKDVWSLGNVDCPIEQ